MNAQASKLTFVLGGSRSGKSRFAQGLPAKDVPVIYWATGLPIDSEMEERIVAHRQSRPGHWGLLEEPRDLLEGLKKLHRLGAKHVLLDSLTAWAGNIMVEDKSGGASDGVLEQLRIFLEELTPSSMQFVIVSDEVGMGLVPDTAMGRRFRDLLGDANQVVAAASDRVYQVCAGIPLLLR